MRILRKLLLPFSLLYGGIVLLRNELYNRNIKTSYSFEIPVICIGNLSMGGTGKSPMLEHLVSMLQDKYKLASLSRGYKRETKGFQLVTGKETAAAVGDEPLQFKTKFPELLVAVDEKRVHGIQKLLSLENKPEIILLDDAFQHRQVRAGLNILLTAYSSLYVGDWMLPMGNLREPATGAKRANVVVVTKCPKALSQASQRQIRSKLKLEPNQKLFFSKIAYSQQISNSKQEMELEQLKHERVCLVTGIANPKALVNYLNEMELSFEHLTFPDHHQFSGTDLKNINSKNFVVTTEKDFMRLKSEVPLESLYFLPIKTQFLGDGEAERFAESIDSYLMKK